MIGAWPRRLAPLATGLLLVLVLAAIRIADPWPLVATRDIAFDLYQRLAPRPDAPLPVEIVDIDEASLAEYGQWPWPRDRLARLTRRLIEMGAASVAFDILFPEPDRLSPSRIAQSLAASGAIPPAGLPDYDAQFAAALAAGPTVLGFGATTAPGPLPGAPKAGIAVSGADPGPVVARMRGAAVPIDPLAAAASGLGALSLDAADSAATVRRLPLLWSDGTRLYPALSLEALRIATGAGAIVVLTDTSGHGWVDEIRVGDFVIPTTPEGDLTLWFRHFAHEDVLSARTVLGPNYMGAADRISGRIVLVGTSAVGLYDLRGTAIGDNMPGVAIHAQALEQMLSGDFLIRADWLAALELFAFVVIAAALVVAILLSGPLAGLALGLGALVTVVLASWVGFARFHLLIDPTFPMIGAFIVFAMMGFVRFATTDADRRRIRRAFGHYVAPALLSEIERNRARLKLGGEKRELTVLFADIRGFTGLAEVLPPERLLAVLNTLLGALGAEITAHSGTIDKFIGDSVMAFWNAPLPQEDHARLAARAALAMSATVARLNADGAFGAGLGRPCETLRIGIGIATGEALVGNMGLESRFDYSCIGDSVNVASRLEGATRRIGYDIVVSARTRAALAGFALLPTGAIILKGKTAPEPAWILVGDEIVAASGAFAAFEAAHTALLAGLRRGPGRVPPAALARCRSAASAVSPDLGEYVDTLPERPGDFASRAGLGVKAG